MSDYLKMINERGIGALDQKMGIEIIEALSLIHISEPTRQAESRMPSSA